MHCSFYNLLIPNSRYFIDSTPLKSCHIKREKQNKVFDRMAEKSKSTMGWFYGFKLYLVINDKGQIMACKLTGAKTDDRKVVDMLTEGLIGKVIGDKGYIKKHCQKLCGKGVYN